MNRAPRIKLSPDQLAVLLAGKPVEGVRQDGSLPNRGESYPITLVEIRVEHTEVRAIVTGQRLRRRPDGQEAKRSWDLDLIVDRAEAPMLLNAESGGGSITPLADDRSADEADAHGYTDRTSKTLDAGDAVPHEEVLTSSQTQVAAERFAAEKVDELTKRRARSIANRVRDGLMQARGKGIDPAEAIEAIEAQLKALETAVKKAA